MSSFSPPCIRTSSTMKTSASTGASGAALSTSCPGRARKSRTRLCSFARMSARATGMPSHRNEPSLSSRISTTRPESACPLCAGGRSRSMPRTANDAARMKKIKRMKTISMSGVRSGSSSRAALGRRFSMIALRPAALPRRYPGIAGLPGPPERCREVPAIPGKRPLPPCRPHGECLRAEAVPPRPER